MQNILQQAYELYHRIVSHGGQIYLLATLSPRPFALQGINSLTCVWT